MTTKITDLQDFYKVLKTITFELKAYEPEDQGIQFQKTRDFVIQKYFPVQQKSPDGIDELREIIKFGSVLVYFSDRFTDGLTKKSFDWFGFDARKIQKFLSQIFFVAETFTGLAGKYVKREDTIRGFKEILEGKHDTKPEEAFYMKGGIEEVI